MEKTLKKYFAQHKEALAIALLVMLATTLPYLVGFASQGADWRFSGFVMGVEDGNSYIAKMLSGSAGSWLFRSPYSIEPQRGVLAFLPYLVLGKLAAPPARHAQLVAIFHGFRFLAGMLAALASYDFLCLFTEKKAQRLWGLSLVLLGGGLGWILVAAQMKDFLGSLPLDFISPESFGFLGLLGLPHLAAARACLLWGFGAYLSREKGWLAGILWLVMGLFQPMFVVLAWCVAGLHSLILLFLARAKEAETIQPARVLRTSAQAILISSPIVLYTAYSFLRDPYLIGWSEQNILPSPHWLHYLIAFGLVLPLALLGISRRWKQQPRIFSLLFAWIAAFPFFVYAPVTTQRRLAEGIWVVLIAGALGLMSSRQTVPGYAKVLSVFILPSSLLIWIGGMQIAANPNRPAFLPVTEARAFLYLDQRAPEGAVVLSDFSTGNSLPAWAPVTVVIGHGPESVRLAYWEDGVESALGGSADADPCLGWFEATGVDFLFWGPAERSRWDFQPDQHSCLLPMYNSDGYQIYRIIGSDYGAPTLND